MQKKKFSLEKTLMLGKIEGRRRRGPQRMRWLDGIINSMNMSLSNSGKQWRTGKPTMLQSVGSQRVGHDWATELSRTECPTVPIQGTRFCLLQKTNQSHAQPFCYFQMWKNHMVQSMVSGCVTIKGQPTSRTNCGLNVQHSWLSMGETTYNQ